MKIVQNENKRSSIDENTWYRIGFKSNEAERSSEITEALQSQGCCMVETNDMRHNENGSYTSSHTSQLVLDAYLQAVAGEGNLVTHRVVKRGKPSLSLVP